MTIHELELSINEGAETKPYKVTVSYSETALPKAQPGDTCFTFDEFKRLETMQLMVRDLPFDGSDPELQPETWVGATPTGLDSLIAQELIDGGIVKGAGKIYTHLGRIDGGNFNVKVNEDEVRHWLDAQDATTIEAGEQVTMVNVPSSIPKHDKGE